MSDDADALKRMDQNLQKMTQMTRGVWAVGCGGAVGAHVLSRMRQDPVMVDMLKRLVPGLIVQAK